MSAAISKWTKSCAPTIRIWALGDCNGKGAFTHTSYNDYEIVADNLLNNAGAQGERSHHGVRLVSPIRRSGASA